MPTPQSQPWRAFSSGRRSGFRRPSPSHRARHRLTSPPSRGTALAKLLSRVCRSSSLNSQRKSPSLRTPRAPFQAAMKALAAKLGVQLTRVAPTKTGSHRAISSRRQPLRNRCGVERRSGNRRSSPQATFRLRHVLIMPHSSDSRRLLGAGTHRLSTAGVPFE